MNPVTLRLTAGGFAHNPVAVQAVGWAEDQGSDAGLRVPLRLFTFFEGVVCWDVHLWDLFESVMANTVCGWVSVVLFGMS